jgi:ferritin-like metal-binding protein YciE
LVVTLTHKSSDAIQAFVVQPDFESNHLEETKGQVTRLEKIGEILTKKMAGKNCVEGERGQLPSES